MSLLAEDAAKRLLYYAADFDNSMVNDALDKVKKVLVEKLASGDSVEDDLADFSLMALMASESFEGDSSDGVMVRVMLEEIWHDEDDGECDEEEDGEEEA